MQSFTQQEQSVKGQLADSAIGEPVMGRPARTAQSQSQASLASASAQLSRSIIRHFADRLACG
jgi:hypothetical protein